MPSLKTLKRNKTFRILAENKLLIFFILFIFFYFMYYFNNFYVPASDFFAFRESALELRELNLPEDLKRLPLFPLAIGLFSYLLPVEYPVLLAAEIINLVLSLISIVLIYLISSKFLKKLSFLVVWLFALHPMTVWLTTQPLAETLLLFTVLLALYFDICMSRKSYIAAFLSSITRCEGFLLVPVITLKNLIYKNKKASTLIFGLLASIGIILWFFLNFFWGTSQTSYLSQIQSASSVGFNFLKSVFITTVSYIPLDYIAFFLFVIGAYYFIRTSFRNSFSMLLFWLSYILLHAFFISDYNRFVFPVLWINFLLIVGGLEYLIDYFKERKTTIKITKTLRIIFNLFSIAIFVLFIFYNTHIFRKLGFNSIFYAGFMIFVFYFVFLKLKVLSYPIIRNTKTYFAAFSLILLLISVATGSALTVSKNWMEEVKYYSVERRLLGEWYAENVNPGDILLTASPKVAIYYSNLPPDYFIALGDINCSQENGQDCFISQLKEKNIKYVVAGSYNATSAMQQYYFDKWKIYLLENISLDDEHFKPIKKIQVKNHSPIFVYQFVGDSLGWM